MMGRNRLITSVVLVIAYVSICLVGNQVSEKYEALSGLFLEVLEDEKNNLRGLKNLCRETSKKNTKLFELTEQIIKEVDLVESSIEKGEYHNTTYLRRLFTKFSIDQESLNLDFRSNTSKYQLYRALNQYLGNHYQFLTKHNDVMSNTKFRLANRRDTYQVDDLHRLDFEFYEEFSDGNSIKSFYEIDGVKKRIHDLPLILDFQPKKIDFSTELTNVVTGEVRTYKSKFTP